MFLDIDFQSGNKIAVIDDSKQFLTYEDLVLKSDILVKKIHNRTLLFILADNSIEPFLAYYSCLNSNIVPLILNHQIDEFLLENLVKEYQPEYIFKRKGGFEDYIDIEGFTDFGLEKTGFKSPILHPDLAMLLPTSGSTGSPKLVRHTKVNLEFSASKVSEFFSIDSSHAAIAFLPMYYTMGLSVINSHLKGGGKVILTNRSLTDREFWNVMKENQITSFTGVPYSFEILDKLRFFRMDLPSLKILTQGGGKLNENLFEKFAKYAQEKGIKFIPTYGQTEGTARMAYLPAEMVFEKKGSIGKAIPGGYLGVVNEIGQELPISEFDQVGEMIYKGDNVTLGYAGKKEDLQNGDENNGYLFTGDIVRRDEDGYFFIIGRKKRFLKLFGLRVSLDEIENLVKFHFDVDCIGFGNDDGLTIGITKLNLIDQVKEYICAKTGLFHGVVHVVFQEEIKRNEAGKIILN